MREATTEPASRLGAALLNLSGLGAGYAYLGRWRLAAAHLAGTAALVGGAFLADAAEEPWLWRILETFPMLRRLADELGAIDFQLVGVCLR